MLIAGTSRYMLLQLLLRGSGVRLRPGLLSPTTPAPPEGGEAGESYPCDERPGSHSGNPGARNGARCL